MCVFTCVCMFLPTHTCIMWCIDAHGYTYRSSRLGFNVLFHSFLPFKKFIYVCSVHTCVSCVHESTCVSVHVHVCVVHICTHLEVNSQHQVFFSIMFHLFLRKSVIFVCFLLNFIEWLASETRVLVPAPGLQEHIITSGLSCMCWGPNSGPHAFTASLSPKRALLQPHLAFVCFRILLCNPVWPWTCKLCTYASFIVAWQEYVSLPGIYPLLLVWFC